ncbi:hypothetical protein [Paenibacillus taihuensis]|uniref:hypothetical protein n=1 Tax=Paenibacillus taihuensis TaxID=1156355 RepID=UPI0011C03550|nr:hypothetical protein [Paenibacillus taihuensis]
MLEVDDRKRMLEVDDRKRMLEVNDRKRVLEVNVPERVAEEEAHKLAGGTIVAEPMLDRRARKRISRSQQDKRRPSLVNDQ